MGQLDLGTLGQRDCIYLSLGQVTEGKGATNGSMFLAPPPPPLPCVMTRTGRSRTGMFERAAYKSNHPSIDSCIWTDGRTEWC